MPIRQAALIDALLSILDLAGRVLLLVQLAKELRKFADSRKLLFLGMNLLYMTSRRFSALGGWRHRIYDFLNFFYLRLAIKFDPSTWYESDGWFPWFGGWGRPGVISSMDIPWTIDVS
jgi:hypothetical protein